MNKMKKLLITFSLTSILFISSSISVFAGPDNGGGITPNSFKISPVNILSESSISVSAGPTDGTDIEPNSFKISPVNIFSEKENLKNRLC